MSIESNAEMAAKSVLATISLLLFGGFAAVCILAVFAMLFSGDWSLMFLIVPAAAFSAAMGWLYGWALYGKA
jgi:hypothetical protein